MKIILDMFRVILFSILLLFMFSVKIIKSLLGWILTCVNQLMDIGENGLDGEIIKLKTLIKNIIKKNYMKIKS